MSQTEIMVTLIFGSGALLIGIYFFMASYASGIKEVYGMHASRTMYDVILRNLIVHLMLIAVTFAVINSLEVVSGFEIYKGIKRVFDVDWFGSIATIPEGRYDIKSVTLMLGWIKLVTVLILAIGPVFLFFAIILRQTSLCTKSYDRDGWVSCSGKILFPAIFFLTVMMIHLKLSSILMTGGGSNDEYLRLIAENWWKDTLGLHI